MMRYGSGAASSGSSSSHLANLPHLACVRKCGIRCSNLDDSKYRFDLAVDDSYWVKERLAISRLFLLYDWSKNSDPLPIFPLLYFDLVSSPRMCFYRLPFPVRVTFQYFLGHHFLPVPQEESF